VASIERAQNELFYSDTREFVHKNHRTTATGTVCFDTLDACYLNVPEHLELSRRYISGNGLFRADFSYARIAKSKELSDTTLSLSA